MDLSIKLLTPEEQKYTYTQSQQLIGQTGCIGHLRAYLDTEEVFHSNWDDHDADLKTPEFRSELTEVVNTIRYGPIYVDKNDCMIQDHDKLRYDDGTVEEVFTLEDNTKGICITNPDYLKHHPDAEDRYVSLISTEMKHGLRKLYHAEISDLPDPEARRNAAMCGAILESRYTLKEFCYSSQEASFEDFQAWGLRINTPEHSYLMRLNPEKGEYNLYCYCYKRDCLDRHMRNAQRGIRFITPFYEEKFRLQDGDKVRITARDGMVSDRTARYIDDYHLELGNSIYHICELAEQLERSGGTVIPLRSSLPEKCFVYVESTDEIGVVERGEQGYAPTGIRPEGVSMREGVDSLNEAQGITKAQAAAMKAGSLCGWDTKAADPANYNETGVLQRRASNRDLTR